MVGDPATWRVLQGTSWCTLGVWLGLPAAGPAVRNQCAQEAKAPEGKSKRVFKMPVRTSAGALTESVNKMSTKSIKAPNTMKPHWKLTTPSQHPVMLAWATQAQGPLCLSPEEDASRHAQECALCFPEACCSQGCLTVDPANLGGDPYLSTSSAWMCPAADPVQTLAGVNFLLCPSCATTILPSEEFLCASFLPPPYPFCPYHPPS